MHYSTVYPPSHLKEIVRFFWVLEGNASPNNPFSHTSMASNSAEIIFHSKGKFKEVGDVSYQNFSLLHAQTRKVRTFVTTEDFSIFGVYIYPTAIPLLFNLPSQYTTDNIPSLVDLLGQEGKILEEQIMLSENIQSKIKLILNLFNGRLRKAIKKDDLMQKCIHHINKEEENFTVTELANQFNLSLRQFERRFKENAGFNPKTYLKITRFQQSLKYYNTLTPKTLTEIALFCGYYDQSHFIHDFTSFSGFHPKKYFGGNDLGQSYR